MKLDDYHSYLKPRPHHAHKGDFGHVLIVGSDVGYTGAARIAAAGALRVGAGLVTTVTRAEHQYFMNIQTPEIMTSADLTAQLPKATVIVIGTGLGQSDWSKSQFELACASGKPLVVDADALNLLARTSLKKDYWILTPHPGEAARLLNTDTVTIQKDRPAAIRALQQKYGGTLVLKGAGTLVLSEQGDIKQCEAGNPGMASGGMGDLLSGIIGGLLAQGQPMNVAAECGVCLHAQAADLCAKQMGERGMLATDLLPLVRQLVNPFSSSV
jgi:hydroxyethylthiazole kinase-like uncharacterized protein yjeF